MIRNIVTIATAVLAAGICQAAPSFVTAPIPVRVTHVPEWYRPTTSRLCFTALSVDPGCVAPPTSVVPDTPAPLRTQLLPVASWTLPNGASGLPANVALITAGKNILPGDYVLECWLDLDGDGKFAPGEPYGCARIDGLTPSVAIDRLSIELMEVSPVVARMDLSTLINAMPSSTNSPPAFGPLAAATDSGRWSVPFSSVASVSTCGTNKPPSSSQVVRVRIVRDRINGQEGGGQSYSAVMMDRYFDTSVRPTLTEADVVGYPGNDIDFSSLNKAYNGMSTPTTALTNAQYRIVIGDGDVGQLATSGNNLPLTFVKNFEMRDAQSPTLDHAVSLSTNFSDHGINVFPKFAWSQTNTICKPYPSFRIRVFTNSQHTAALDAVYDSGVQKAPSRNAYGMYTWTAPFSPGMTVTNIVSATTNVCTFAADKTYWWRVSMIDSKFTGMSQYERSNEFVMPSFTNSTPLSH